MRISVSVINQSDKPIDYNYSHGLSAMLYKTLANVDIKLANETHTHQGFKFYTFSQLKITNKKYNKHGLDFKHASFIISSPDNRFIKSFAEGLLQIPEFFLNGYLGKVGFVIDRVEILPDISFNNECWFETISPIFMKIQQEHEGKLVETELYPTNPVFYTNLRRNLVERYINFYGKSPINYFDIKEIDNVKPKRIKISNSYRRCNLMNLRIRASPELLKFAYDAGLGEKNAMGFGCIEVI